jgi:mannose-6-phosphate isomerase-like protein (cupin superfamily)
MGSLMIWHVTSAESAGGLSLGEVVVRAGGEPPMHVHAREDEVWFVLEGSVLFQRGHERLLAGPGTAVMLPRGIPHGFAVRSEQARILHAYTPAGLEEAFRALSTPAPAPQLPPAPLLPPDDAELARAVEVYGAHGVTFVGPPLAALLAAEAAA